MSNLATKFADLIRAVTGRQKNIPKTTAIVLAAGSSVRMGGPIPKQLIELEGLPVIIHSLLAFEGAAYVSEIILVVPEGDESYYAGFDSWVRKIPWRREWLSTPVFLHGEFHGQRSRKESDATE